MKTNKRTKHSNESTVVGGVDLDNLPENLSSEEVKTILDAADHVLVTSITASNLKKFLSQLESRIMAFEEEKLKTSEPNQKLLTIEAEIENDLHLFRQISADVQLFDLFISSDGLRIVTSLLQSENEDIISAATLLILELTSTELIVESKNKDLIVDAIVYTQLPLLVLRVLEQQELDDFLEEYQVVTSCLQIFDNLIETQIKGIIDSIEAQAPSLIPWLLNYINPKIEICYNKAFVGEILMVLLQTSVPCKDYISQTSELRAVERFLECLTYYRNKQPQGVLEREFVENVGDCLTILLDSDTNKNRFRKAQGIELMIRLLRERLYAYPIALKLLTYVLDKSPANCSQFVEKLGLQYLFGIFMKKGKCAPEGTPKQVEEEELCVSIIYHLQSNLTGLPATRLLNKLTEQDCEKTERLLELHTIYCHRVREGKATRRRNEVITQIASELDIDPDDQEYLDACEDGLNIVQLIDIIIVRFVSMGNSNIITRVRELLDLKGIKIKEFTTIEDYAKRALITDAERETLMRRYDYFKNKMEYLSNTNSKAT